MSKTDAPGIPKPTSVVKPLAWFKRRQNIREVKRDESLKELERSIQLYGMLNPLVGLDDGTLVCGYRRLTCAEELDLVDVPVSIYPSTLTELQIIAIQAVENMAREDLSEQELFGFCEQCEQAGMTRSEIGPATGKSPGSITRYLSPNDCPPEAKELFLSGRLTLGQCYKISTSPEPLETMKLILGGASLADVKKRAGRKPGTREKSDAVTVSSIKLAFRGGRTVIVKGADMTLAGVVEILASAKKEAEAGLEDGQDARTFQDILANRAKATPGQGKKRRGRRKAASAD